MSKISHLTSMRRSKLANYCKIGILVAKLPTGQLLQDILPSLHKKKLARAGPQGGVGVYEWVQMSMSCQISESAVHVSELSE
jgi:hypothetical protein